MNYRLNQNRHSSPRSMTRTLAVGMLCAVLPCSVLSCSVGAASGPKCSDRVGRCFDARIDNLPVVPLTDRSALDRYIGSATPEYKAELQRVAWVLTVPPGKKFELRTMTLQDGLGWFGTGETTLETKIVPLQGQVLPQKTTRKIPGAKAERKAPPGPPPTTISVSDLGQGRLLPGDYLFEVTLRTERNSDTKFILLTVQ